MQRKHADKRIQAVAWDNPVVHAVLNMSEAQGLDERETLVQLALHLVESNAELRKRLHQELSRNPAPVLIRLQE